MKTLVRSVAIMSGVLCWYAASQDACAQASYTNFYNSQLSNYTAPDLNAKEYTWDKYLYHNTNVTPYLNLLRPDYTYLPDYQAYVVPEEQRRAQQAEQWRTQRAAGSPANARSVTSPSFAGNSFQQTAAPARTDSFYDNHWYGGWQNRR